MPRLCAVLHLSSCENIAPISDSGATTRNNLPSEHNALRYSRARCASPMCAPEYLRKQSTWYLEPQQAQIFGLALALFGAEERTNNLFLRKLVAVAHHRSNPRFAQQHAPTRCALARSQSRSTAGAEREIRM